MNPPGPAVALIGPTATGKSALAHELARSVEGAEVIVLDAMTVYRGMDIATAKPTAAERREVSYHLLDVIEPSEEFALAPYQAAARSAAAEIWGRGGSVVYVGGTGLYGRAVLDDFEIPGRFPEIAADLEARVAGERDALYAQLVELDPLGASRIEASNDRRLVRALEVTLGSGRPFSSFGPGLDSYGEVRVAQIGLVVALEVLDARIEARFRRFLDEGLVDEVRALAATSMSRTARQAVGYRELLAHVEDGEDLERCVEAAIHATRRLARRQLRWFRRDPRIEWFEDPSAALARATRVLRDAKPSGKLGP
ncbi:MAG TPA: tRNA (adenosine(37)-N6)-dimethylallyltransferase MiaA [Acidimicrobiales bacterium]|nr:tRNA (adenosine(37)-N6)-dimethylallyltransferase MiaA [Acidimicrobiales bacterium]